GERNDGRSEGEAGEGSIPKVGLVCGQSSGFATAGDVRSGFRVRTAEEGGDCLQRQGRGPRWRSGRGRV
ncbi:hypothetical protein LINPERHAP1_LOCUS24972, partial [Linum perenne]